MDADDIGLSCLNEKLKPICGLEFDSEQSVYDFYNAYGQSMGFSVRKETYGRKKRTDELTSKCAHMIPSQWTLTSSQAMEVDLVEESGIALKSSYELLGRQAISEKTPKTILTEQDVAMAKAISHVMPNTYHRLCTWHMMQNALKHVNDVFRGPSGVKAYYQNLLMISRRKTNF
ncbi:hypothetical protein Ddye_004622 [Dipteronia dyeriana]|uniref:Protein FAR1-RELATED SEQUENCE n=1 Tax=Dipteronia dyeriana TaxID=168575 RepID=A0AAD9XVD1_9ROSI|nr:hypothetical protein Ddye_004622 [Dipteronia dyeriana]